jgi:phenylalanyl-tRNA synthetase alpha chain
MSKPKEIFLPSLDKEIGAIHPINQVKFDLIKLLTSFGFEVAEGPEIESEEFNFDMLNIPATHPAREMHDTFYVDGMKKVLRTHTSPVQVRCMLEKRGPMAFVSPGKVYRKDDDATHLPMFHQIEGILIDEDVSFAHLKDLIYKICHSLFGEEAKLRFRPSFFPFTEPSAEVDVLFGDQWLEILGCGIVNPKVLNNCEIDTKKYSGLAFGLGIERIAMLKYKVNDIRDFYKSNLDFLRQFK